MSQTAPDSHSRRPETVLTRTGLVACAQRPLPRPPNCPCPLCKAQSCQSRNSVHGKRAHSIFVFARDRGVSAVTNREQIDCLAVVRLDNKVANVTSGSDTNAFERVGPACALIGCGAAERNLRRGRDGRVREGRAEACASSGISLDESRRSRIRNRVEQTHRAVHSCSSPSRARDRASCPRASPDCASGLLRARRPRPRAAPGSREESCRSGLTAPGPRGAPGQGAIAIRSRSIPHPGWWLLPSSARQECGPCAERVAKASGAERRAGATGRVSWAEVAAFPSPSRSSARPVRGGARARSLASSPGAAARAT